MRSANKILFLAVMTTITVACSSNACFDDIDPLVISGLFTTGTGALDPADSIRITGMTSSSSIIFVEAREISYFSLPLNPAEESITLLIDLNEFTDTAYIRYTNYPHLVSSGCGYTFYSTILSLKTTHNIIDTLIIENKNVTLDGERNLRLFY